MQDSSAFQYIGIDLIDMSTTKPRRTFDEGSLRELTGSIRLHGLIQPIVVRLKNGRFEIVAGERRYRSSLLAERFSVPSHIVELTDAQALEWQLVENSQRVCLHMGKHAKRSRFPPGYPRTS